MTLAPNERDVSAVTLGIGRNLGLDGLGRLIAEAAFLTPDQIAALRAAARTLPDQYATGGGDLNGSAATPLFGKAGVNGSRQQSIRSPGARNYCGII
jgi:hypothetical protein